MLESVSGKYGGVGLIISGSKGKREVIWWDCFYDFSATNCLIDFRIFMIPLSFIVCIIYSVITTTLTIVMKKIFGVAFFHFMYQLHKFTQIFSLFCFTYSCIVRFVTQRRLCLLLCPLELGKKKGMEGKEGKKEKE